MQQKDSQSRIRLTQTINTTKALAAIAAEQKEKERKLKEAAKAKTKYQIISLILDTPHNKKLKEQYIKDNPEITKHELYPILEIIHNYIYEETEQSTTEQEKDKENANSQKSIQNTTEQEKRQIFILSILHNKIQSGHKHILEFNGRINDLRLYAHKAPAYKIQHLYRTLHNAYGTAWKKGHGSVFMSQFIKVHKLCKDNPNKLSAHIQSMLKLIQIIQNTENSGQVQITKITLLEVSAFALAGLYIDHYPKKKQLEFLQAAKISKPQTEEEAKKLIENFLTTIQPKTGSTPFATMQKLLQKKIQHNNIR